MPPLSHRVRCAGLAAVVGLLWSVGTPAQSGEFEMRVESEVFVDQATTPVATSLTLFRGGLAWDFLDASEPGAGGEIVLHDPARERVVVIDTKRNLKAEVEVLRLERLAASLAAWARRSDDRLVRWAAGPDFESDPKADDRTITLTGPRVRYEVVYGEAPSADAAEVYRDFADTAVLLKALLHPGGLPPFPRLEINKRIAAAGGIPQSASLEIEAWGALLGARPQVLRSVHKVHPRLLSSDLERIEDAEARVALASGVDLAAYAEPGTTSPVSAAK